VDLVHNLLADAKEILKPQFDFSGVLEAHRKIYEALKPETPSKRGRKCPSIFGGGTGSPQIQNQKKLEAWCFRSTEASDCKEVMPDKEDHRARKDSGHRLGN
jgi:hypothetical protein